MHFEIDTLIAIIINIMIIKLRLKSAGQQKTRKKMYIIIIILIVITIIRWHQVETEERRSAEDEEDGEHLDQASQGEPWDVAQGLKGGGGGEEKDGEPRRSSSVTDVQGQRRWDGKV